MYAKVTRRYSASVWRSGDLENLKKVRLEAHLRFRNRCALPAAGVA